MSTCDLANLCKPFDMTLPFTPPSFFVDCSAVLWGEPIGCSRGNSFCWYLFCLSRIRVFAAPYPAAIAGNRVGLSIGGKPKFLGHPNICNRSHSGCSTSPTCGDKHRRVESALDYWCHRVSRQG